MPSRLPRFLPHVLAALGLIAVVATARAWPVEAQGHRVEPGVVVDEVLGVGVLESARGRDHRDQPERSEDVGEEPGEA